MLRILIHLILISILTIGIGAYFVQKPLSDQEANKCGDSVCQPQERLLSNCTQDCKNTSNTKSPPTFLPKPKNTPSTAQITVPTPTPIPTPTPTPTQTLLTTCSALNGNICSDTQTCSCTFISASDSNSCCNASCITKTPADIKWKLVLEDNFNGNKIDTSVWKVWDWDNVMSDGSIKATTYGKYEIRAKLPI